MAIRYRSYYYENSVGMYYLQSRYYYATAGRFINADDPQIALDSKEDTDGTNLFAYCCNDPVNNVDPTGYWVGYIGISGNASFCLGINGSISLLFDGKTLAIVFSFSYKTVGIGLGVGISGGFYPNYKNVDKFYKDKLGTISIYIVDIFKQPKGTKGKIKGAGITISALGQTLCSISVPTHTKMYKIKLKKSKKFIKSLITKKVLKKLKLKSSSVADKG